MERRFDMSNFEQSLKEHADQFKMIPSKRVWHGIYNDLHPGSKWPSIAMGFVILFTLVGIGHLNNTPKLVVDINSVSEKNGLMSAKTPIAEVNSSPEKNTQQGNSSAKIRNIHSAAHNLQTAINSGAQDNLFTSKNTGDAEINSAPKTLAKIISLYPDKINQNNSSETENLQQETSSGYDKVNNANSLFNKEVEPQSNNPADLNIPKNDELSASLTHIDPVNIHLDGNSSAEQIALNKEGNKKNVTIHRKQNTRINWIYFVTPGLSTVSFVGKGFQPANPNPNNSPVIIQPDKSTNGITHNRLGYQFGTEMTYTFSKEWQIVTGAHLSYSGYSVISNPVHPTYASLLLKDETTGLPYSQSYITFYGNGYGANQISLANYSFQLSLPVGFQYALFSGDNIQINLATTLEPSLVLKSNAYILSSDGRNYVNDPSLLRKLNLSGNLGSFVTFKATNIKWQLGPNIRYQLFSTYQKNYPIREHLIDYGIRIGISR